MNARHHLPFTNPSNRHLMKRLFALLALVGWFAGSGMAPAASSKPNIVLILADDLGYGDLGCYGGSLPTPNIDALAREGLRFTDFHSNGAVCSPTRAALLTGRYQQRSGIEGVITAANHRDQGLALSETTFAEVLKQGGYTTAIFGKWHLGYEAGFNPTHQGFDEFRGFLSGNVDYRSHVDQEGYADWWNGTKLTPEEGYTTDLITKHAVRFIAENKGRPFCLYLPHEAVHYPYQTRDDAADREAGKKPANVAGSRTDKEKAYASMMTALDESVGRVMEALKQNGLAKNTLIIFTSDNGPSGPGKAGPLAGKKGTLWEGGHRVPAIAWWPGRIKPGESAETCLTMDLLPTFAKLADVKLPKQVALDGVDLSDLLLKGKALPKRTLFWRFNGMQAVRSGPWKLQVTRQGASHLYHLADDLAEKNDLAEKEPAKLTELQTALKAWTQSVDGK